MKSELVTKTVFVTNSDFTPCFQSNMHDDIEFVWSFISTLIKNAITLFVPMTVMHHNHQPKSCEWLNSDIRHHMSLHSKEKIQGPLLFIIYINSLPDAVLHSKTLMFADDTKYFRHTVTY